MRAGIFHGHAGLSDFGIIFRASGTPAKSVQANWLDFERFLFQQSRKPGEFHN